MSLHPCYDAEELRRVLDCAGFEDLVGALVRRSERTLALGEAAYHEMQQPATTPGRARELSYRCAASSRMCAAMATAVHALAPDHEMDRQGSAFARVAANIAQLAVERVCSLEAVAHG